MKGDNTITNTFLIIGSLLLVLLVVLQIAPIFTQFLTSAALDSPSLVSKEIAELTTISAAAPNGMDIIYNPSKSKYDLDVADRIVKVSIINPDNQQVKDTFIAKIAVDVVATFKNVNVFNIRNSPNIANEITIQAS